MTKWRWRAAGLSGGTIPLVGDVITGLGSRALAARGHLQQARWLGQGATASVGLGASIALDQYNQRWGLSNMAARNLQSFTLGAYQAPAAAWESSPSQSWKNRGVGFSVESRVVRSKPSPTGRRRSSAQTRSPIRLGKSRNRCRTRYRGKRCRLPAGHSGRHSYS